MNSLKKAQEFTFNIPCKHEAVLYLAKSHNNLACTSLGNELLFYLFLNMLLLTNGQNESKPSFRGWLAYIVLLIGKYSEISEVSSSNLELKTWTGKSITQQNTCFLQEIHMQHCHWSGRARFLYLCLKKPQEQFGSAGSPIAEQCYRSLTASFPETRDTSHHRARQINTFVCSEMCCLSKTI